MGVFGGVWYKHGINWVKSADIKGKLISDTGITREEGGGWG